MFERIDITIQPQLMRVHVARKAKRCNKLRRDCMLKRWPKAKPPALPCPWPAPRLTPWGELPIELMEGRLDR